MAPIIIKFTMRVVFQTSNVCFGLIIEHMIKPNICYLWFYFTYIQKIFLNGLPTYLPTYGKK